MQEYEAIIVHPDKAIGVVKSTLWGQVDNMEMERQTDLVILPIENLYSVLFT